MLHVFEADESQVSEQILEAIQMPVFGHEVFFRAHATAGGGDCGIHALCGHVADGRYFCPRPRVRLQECFSGGYEHIDAQLRVSDPEGAFWPYVQKYIWQELFVETYNGKNEAEGRRFYSELQRLQPELHADARNFLEQDTSRRQQQQALWQSLQESARALFRIEVWQTVLQHALVNLGVLPSVCILEWTRWLCKAL